MPTDVENTLNNLYKTDFAAYQDRVTMIKMMGAKVYRNSLGEHKIKYNMNDVMSAMNGLNEYRKRRNMEAFMKGVFGE